MTYDQNPAAAPAATAPSECRGYAHLGIGAYIINHSRAGTEPELLISLATEEEKRGRVVGDTRDNPPDAVLQPDAMVVRLRFENEAGFDALLHQLKLLREVHFSDPDDGRYHGFPPQDAAPAPVDKTPNPQGSPVDKSAESQGQVAAPAPDADRVPNDDEVICPGCTHQFRAIPVNVQAELASLRGATPCCGEWFSCDKPCTPRANRWREARNDELRNTNALQRTVEQQARELAEARAIVAEFRSGARKTDMEVQRDEALRDLSAARAAIAAADADAARYRFLRMSPTQLGWDADYRPDEVDAAIDAARAAMGDGNG